MSHNMTHIQTVLGVIRPEELGVTYAHDHLLFCPPAPYASQDPDLRLDSIEAAIRELTWFKEAGGQGFVEMSTVEMGRSPEGLRTIAEETGVHIIAATGYNKGKFAEPFLASQSIEAIAEQEVRDLLEGMDGTGIRAGLIKASSSKDHMSPGEEKAFAAAAIAHHRTGAPISTHTEAGTLGLEQVRRLTEDGVPPESIIIGHLDRKLEWEYLQAVAETGVFLSFDQVSKEKYYPDELRITFIRRLIEAGHGAQVLLSGDLARKSYWPSYGFGHGPGLTYILWRFVPWMLESGISREAVEQILVHNPARAFAWRAVG